MNIEIAIAVIVLGLAVLAGTIWNARRVDRQYDKADEITAASGKLQNRENELVARWEAVVTRFERLADRLEKRDQP